MSELIIHDGNYTQFINPVVAGETRLCTAIPRDYQARPQGFYSFAPSFDLPLIPESEQQQRLELQLAAQAECSKIRLRGNHGQPIPSTDQNGKGYCWAHSGTSGALIIRAIQNLPYVPLSAYAVACMIKGFRDQGGNGIEGVEFVATRGIPSATTWPLQSMSRSNDNPATWTDAANHKWTDWMDGEPRNKQQLITCLLLGIPVVIDLNWWGHSVLALDLVSLNPFRIRIWNSWGDSWSDRGMGILEGSKAIPDGMVMPRVMTASAA